jgi:exonuclease SbcC
VRTFDYRSVSRNNGKMFTRLFKPRWEHPDPGIRRQALESGEVPADVLAKAAREDRDTDVRRCAVQRLSDLNLLDTLLATEPPGDIRAVAERRRHELLAGPLQSDPPLAARLESLARQAPPGLCAVLAREAQAAEIRSAALEQVIDIEILCTVAIDDPVAGVRRMACERIDDPQGWEIVARDARNRDKQVSRLARERLDAYRKRLEDQQVAKRLCDEIEALAEVPVDSGVRGQLLRLSNHWEQLETPPPDLFVERFSRARGRVAEGIERFNAVLGERQALCADLKSLLDSLRQTIDVESVAVAGLQERLKQAGVRWQGLTRDVEDDETLAQQFAELDRHLRFILERVATDQVRSVPLRALVQQAEELLADDSELDEHQITELQHRWEKLASPASPGLAQALEQEFAACCNRLREQLKRQDARRREALNEAESLIEGLDDVLREGKLERALSRRDRARHLLKVATGVDERRRAALQTRLHRLHPRLEQLRQWRHWGSGNARERLCAELEALAGGVLPAAELATRVRTAREDWKRIDQGEGPAPKALWQRFDRACTQAYAPYQQERREQAERLAAHLTRRQALIEELDAFERNTDWKTVDWRAADRRVRSAVDRWRRIGAVPARSRKSVEKDYRAVLARLESHLESERERELRRRRALIARVEQLAVADDLHTAIRETREAQEAWSPSVQADREQEQQLWRAFRMACDAVFGKAKRERETANSERQANLNRKKALCAELEALLDDPQKAYPEMAQRFAAVAAEWNGIGEIPRQKSRDVESHYEGLGKRLAKRRQQESRAAERTLLRGTRERAQLCERLETAVLDNTLTEAERIVLLEEVRQAWEALAPLDAPQAARLPERFERAGRALAGDGAAREALIDDLPHNLERRQELCLEMEIAAGLDSPEQFSDARLRLQVSRLADALGHRQGGVTDAAGRLRELLLDWYLTGPVPLEMRGGLDARIARVLTVVE